MNRPEERRHHFDGIHARRTGNLHDEQQNAQRSADIAEREGERIEQVHERKRAHRARRHERDGVGAVDAECNVDAANDLRLHEGKQYEQEPTAEIALRGCGAFESGSVDLQLDERYQDEASDPQCEARVERRHGCSVIRDRVDLLGDQVDGRRYELAEIVGVDIEKLGNLIDLQGAAHGVQIGRGRFEVGAHVGKQCLRLLDCADGVDEGGIGLGEDFLELDDLRLELANSARKPREGDSQVVGTVR